jgi:hypothetical protein
MPGLEAFAPDLPVLRSRKQMPAWAKVVANLPEWPQECLRVLWRLEALQPAFPTTCRLM